MSDAEADADRLVEAVASFVRSFGLHRPERTPCGFSAGVAEAHALAQLDGGPLRQMDLGERLGLAKSTVSRLVGGLVDRGWAVRSDADDDGRGVSVALTPEGHRAAAQLRAARARRMAALLGAVPPDRRADAIEVLELLDAAARRSDPRHA